MIESTLKVGIASMKRTLLAVFVALIIAAPAHLAIGAHDRSATFFPGIYPATTQSYAASLQAKVNRGHSQWLLTPNRVAMAFARFIHWPASSSLGTVSRLSSDQVVVALARRDAPAAKLYVALKRLGASYSAIWTVTGCHTKNLVVNTPSAGAHVSSAITVKGLARVFEGQFSLTVFNGGWKKLESYTAHITGQILVTFQERVAYHGHGGYGIIEASALSPKDGSVLEVSMVKVALG